MNSNIFFEGPVRSGKSTVLRQALLPVLPELGGFVVQRLLDANRNPVAYRLISLEEIRHSGDYAKDLFLAVDALYSPQGSNEQTGIFLWTNPRRIDLKVFDTIGVDCLISSSHHKILLLDEIGGVDLLSPLFRRNLLSALKDQTPCIGIIKELGKARDAQLFNRELRALLSVQNLSTGDLSKVPSQVQSFLFSNNI